MASALVIPGVQVRTIFEPMPALPSGTGILGIVGVTDRGPLTPTPVGSFGEFVEIFGPASRFSMPELRTAMANGVMQAVVARLRPGLAQKASLTLFDDDNEPVVRLIARAEGPWGNQLAIRTTQVKALSGRGVKYVNLEILQAGQVIEVFNSLVMDPYSPDYLFDRINAESQTVVAIDPLFEAGLPTPLARTPLSEAEAAPASAQLKAGGAAVAVVEAKRPGEAGLRSAVQVRDGRAQLQLRGAGDAQSVLIRARTPGMPEPAIRVAVNAGAGGGVSLVVTPAAGAPRSTAELTSVAEIVAALAEDPDIEAVAPAGAVMPQPSPSQPLARTVSIDVITEGRETASYEDLPDLAAIAAITDPVVRFTAVEGATALPEPNEGVPLTGGRSRGRALALVGDTRPEPLVELRPARGVDQPLAVAIVHHDSSADLTVFLDEEPVESFAGLTMDPDDPNYLPAVLAERSALIRAHDLFVRSRTTSLPRHQARPQPLTGGTAPLVDDYQEALERLEMAEEVDLVIASAANQLDDAGLRAVHQAVVAHCAKMAEPARNRIGLGSVSPAESASVPDILDHANDVRSDHFVLVAPTGGAPALAGLLARQDYFDSPTFKTIAAPGAPPGQYTDAQLTQLVSGNVLVINERRKRGIIVIKGVLTSGRQVNVQRTANKAVRDVNALAQNYIGLLNNDGTRNAFRQQLIAMFLQMERDGAIVPSTDGRDPAFLLNVYSTQNDFALGIVRVDIAMRPVRAIDYVYATITVKN